MSQFKQLATALAAHFAQMSKGELYRVDFPTEVLWDEYLAAFPEGTNPIYRVRTVHDGSYDRSFIKKLGNVVVIKPDGAYVTLWDLPNPPAPYDVVFKKLRSLVNTALIADLFRIKESKVGVKRNLEDKEGVITEFHHFHAEIDSKHYSPDVATFLGQARSTVQVFERGMRELSLDALDTVLDLIATKALYRGEEFKTQLDNYRKLKVNYDALVTERERALFVWANFDKPAARLRNTAIGTLLISLSEGEDLERAVRAYESIMAPANYKRPTALITKGMIDAAMTTIKQLDLEPALERRHAQLSDLNVTNVLWVDNDAAKQMSGGIVDLLMAEVKPAALDATKTTKIKADEFFSRVLPTAKSLEVFFDNKHQGNLMSLTTTVHPDAPPLFKWGSNFAWSYNGDITDSSITMKVKTAGGNINAALRVSLAWNNYDDLDLHCKCPDGHVHFAAKYGILDVDMNAAGRRQSRTPVENLAWQKPKDGKYTIIVDNYVRVETIDQGFTLEVANNGAIEQYSYPNNSMRHTPLMEFSIKNGVMHDFKLLSEKLTGGAFSQDTWGLSTQRFVKVNTVLNSPNHWDGENVGNKHWFFIIEGCRNDAPTRGIYNEFLKPELEAHRKVFEVLGSKTKVPPADTQLSGLGFSSTKRDAVVVKVTDASSTRLYEVAF